MDDFVIACIFFRCISNTLCHNDGICWLAIVFNGIIIWTVCQWRPSNNMEDMPFISRFVFLLILFFITINIIAAFIKNNTKQRPFFCCCSLNINKCFNYRFRKLIIHIFFFFLIHYILIFLKKFNLKSFVKYFLF